MMDYMRTNEEAIKNEAIKNCKEVFHDLIQSESDEPASLTINRLDGDAKVKSFKKYIDQLHELFPEDLIKIREKAANLAV